MNPKKGYINESTVFLLEIKLFSIILPKFKKY